MKLRPVSVFYISAAIKVDVAVIEVGLGGRLDSTNVVDPLVSVIASLSYDHMDVLGDTLAKIAGEKAGIIKPHRPVVLSPQKAEARKVIETVAAERESKLVEVGKDYLFSPWQHSLDNQSFLVWRAEDQDKANEFVESDGKSADWQPVKLTIPLLGYHQVENAATAYAALQVAREEGLPVSEADIARGFASVFWPGRFEILRRTPPLVIDSAHNRDSALRLRLALEDYLPGEPVILVFGASEDKDVEGMFAELLPRVKCVIGTQSVHPRAMDAGKIVDLAHKFGRKARAVVPIEDALNVALDMAGHEATIVVAGSLFVAAAAREIWYTQLQPAIK